ncbi:hypothetical protein LT679_00645 [Mucilaginibacter roseus]|uniref:Uncharacterized protein n=1 Tax=Mucilaginibacter roseus TaxID=1528868 RepID=A0ABS8TW31_9SPHI|nr:hypothetical protein [Mucilaginibacter roseus]MCD8739093.1 hypothetical protein [Mucilaginibacter roseus]
MLIFLVNLYAIRDFLLTFASMKSKLFEEKPETARTSMERWVRIFPDRGDGYHLYDPLQEQPIGRILFDSDGNWIYDGTALNVEEQEEIAGAISGHCKEMDNLIRSLYEKEH